MALLWALTELAWLAAPHSHFFPFFAVLMLKPRALTQALYP